MGVLRVLSDSPVLRALLVAVASGAWFSYFRLKQRRPKPFWLHLAALVGGFGAALLSVVAFSGLETLGLALDWSSLEDTFGRGLPLSVTIGVVEETAKLLPVLALVWLRRDADSPGDAVFLASCAGIGFASAEGTLLFQAGLSPIEGLARAAASPITHALFAAPVGLGVARYVIRGKRGALAWGFGTSVGGHAAYNLLLARPELPPAVAAGVVLALWIWLLQQVTPGMFRARTALASERTRTTGSMPAIARL